jgi:hypothetical protein
MGSSHGCLQKLPEAMKLSSAQRFRIALQTATGGMHHILNDAIQALTTGSAGSGMQ